MSAEIPPESTRPSAATGSEAEVPNAGATAPGTPAPEVAGAVEAEIAPAEPVAPKHPRRVALLAILAFVIVVADLITKIIAVATLDEGTPPDQQPRILGGLVYFSLIRNPGAAFSMATGMTWLLSLVVIAVIIVIIRLASRLRSKPWAIALGLVLGGAIGNLIDRIFRAPGFLQGHVVDFVSVFGPNAEHFPVFNVADSAITIGGIMLVLTALSGVDYDGTRVAKTPKKIKGAAADRASAPTTSSDEQGNV